MKKIKFWDVPKFIRFLEFDDDKSDMRLHFDKSIRWTAETEAEYNGIENKICAFSIERKSYTVYAWCDISGYDYWVLGQEEPNYIQISVIFNYEDITEDECVQLEDDVINTEIIFQEYEMELN